MKIGEQLIRDGVVSREQVDEALRAQVLYGGRLGTNLVELGFVQLDPLADALGRQHGLAAALDRHFREADPELQERVPVALVTEHRCVPLREVSPGVAAVAFMDPPTEDELRELRQFTGCELVAVIAPELRILYQLEHVYGLPRDQRFLRVTGPERLDDAEQRRYVTPLSAPEAESTLGRIAVQKREVRRARSERVPVAPVEAGTPDAVEELDTLAVGLRAIRAATDRDRVVELAIQSLRSHVDPAMGCGLFLLVRSRLAFGWQGFAAGREDAELAGDIAVPLDEPSVLQLSYRTGVMVCGKPPPGGALIDQRLWRMLGQPAPAECVVAPVKVDNRVVCLVYAHPLDLGDVTAEAAHAVQQIAEAASTAFFRLIRGAER